MERRPPDTSGGRLYLRAYRNLFVAGTITLFLALLLFL